jgi:hypothetical protein
VVLGCVGTVRDRAPRTGRPRGLAPRLGIAYPLARRFRTSMPLGMFSLVILVVTMVTSFSVAIERNTDAKRSTQSSAET